MTENREPEMRMVRTAISNEQNHQKCSEGINGDGELYREQCPNLCGVLCTKLRKSCTKKLVFKRVPILDWLPRYNLKLLLSDFVAGITVGLTAIPQGIAYAVIAGLPPQYGLYSGFMGCFVYLVFGSVKDITVGPTAISALMIAPAVTHLNVDFAILTTFLGGLFILLLGVLHLGFLVQFIASPVVAGFSSAAAITIASSQLKSLFGITSGSSNEFLPSWQNFFAHLNEIRLWDTVLGISSIIILILLKNLTRLDRWKSTTKYISNSRNAIIVIAGIILAFVLDQNGLKPFKVTGNITPGIPNIILPPFSTSFGGKEYNFLEMVQELGTSLITIPLVLVLELIAIAKAFSKGKIVDATQEMIALGLCNIFGSFAQSIPVTGSFTRCAVNNASGVKTPFGGVFTGVLVLLALGLLTGTFYYIPKAVLAAVIIAAMFYMVEIHAIVETWRTKKIDLIPLLVTLITCLLLGLEIGILFGVICNAVFVLYSTSRPDIDFKLEKISDAEILVVTPNQSLMYSSAEYFKASVAKMAIATYPSSKMVLIRGEFIQHIDSTVVKNLESLLVDLKIVHKSLYFWNWNQDPMYTMLRYDRGLVSLFKNSKDVEEFHDKIKLDQNNVKVDVE